MSKKDYHKVEHKEAVTEKEEVVVDSERTPIDPIVKGGVKKKKKGLMERLVVGMIDTEGVGNHITREIIGPAIKDLLVNTITSGVNMMVYGSDSAPRNGRSAGNPYSGARTNYQKQYGQSQPSRSAGRSVSVRADIDNYTLPDRNDANQVLLTLKQQIDRYGYATIADYYDLIGVASTFTDQKYGWGNLERARIVASGREFTIVFPPTEVIE